MSIDELNRAIQLAKAGDKQAARQILLRLVQQEPTNEMAWIWLADTMPDQARRIATLKQCLKIIPQSQIARKALQVLEADQKPAAEKPHESPLVRPSPVSQPAESQPITDEKDLESLYSLRDEVILPQEESKTRLSTFEEIIAQPSRAETTAEPFATPAAIDELRQQVQRATGRTGDRVVETAEELRQKRPTVRWAAIFSILLFAVVVGVAAYFLWYSPISPFRLVSTQPPSSEVGGSFPTPDQSLIETLEVATPMVTEEVQATEEVEEVVATPPPPGIYMSGTPIHSFDWSPDDTFIVVSAGGGLSVFDPLNYGTLRYIDLAGSKALCRISPAVDRTVCGGAKLWAWALPNWEAEIEIPPPGGLPGSWIGMLDFVTSDLLVLVYESDLQSVEIWSLGIQQRDGDLLRASSPIQRLTASPSGGWIVAGLFDGRVIVWDLRSRRPVLEKKVQDEPMVWLSLSADGQRLMTAAAQPPVRVWEIPSGRLVGEIRIESTFTALALSADGKSMAWADRNGRVTHQQIEDGRILNQVEVGLPVRELRFSPDQTRLAVLTGSGDIYFYSLEP